MIRLDVWLTLPSGESVQAGSLVVAEPDTARGGRLRGRKGNRGRTKITI